MVGSWNRLFQASSSKYIGIYDVDCTADGRDLCEEVGVPGYPTLLYGDARDRRSLQRYRGGREFDDLKAFADDNLRPPCSLANMDSCSDEERAPLEDAFRRSSADALAEAEEALSDEDKVLLEGFLKRSSADLYAELDKLDKDFEATQKRLERKAADLEEREEAYKGDAVDLKRFKRGKPSEHKAKTDKLNARKARIERDKLTLEKEQEALKTALATSSVKLMKLAADSKKYKTDL